ncbi:MAG TPA: hypothetical protein VIF09_13095 [Polyangiaceae bacterium]|jgi:hypothetical protein
MPPDDATTRASLQGKRIALVVVIALSVALIGASAWQIIPAVFGANVAPLPASPPGSAARTCAEGVRRMAQALERAQGAAGSASFGERLSPEWDAAADVQKACEASPEGEDAWAALARMRCAAEQLAPRGGELATLHRDVMAHLPADLR